MVSQLAPSGLAIADAGAAPRGEEGVAVARGERVAQTVPAADALQAEEGQGYERGEDDEELEDLVVDRRGEPADRDVREDEEPGDDDRDPLRPAQQRLHHDRQGVEVDAGDQDRGEGEEDRAQQVCGFVEPLEQELGDRPDLGAVVERHHHQAQEDHRRDGADPVPVHDGDAVLRAGGGHAEDLGGAQVGGDEGQAGDPGGQRAAGEEEVETGLDARPRGEADAQDDGEVDRQDCVVESVGGEPKPFGQVLHEVLASSRELNPAEPTRPCSITEQFCWCSLFDRDRAGGNVRGRCMLHVH